MAKEWKPVTLKLTAREAAIIWACVDGQADAGACEGGNTEEEAEVLNRVSGLLVGLKSRRPRKED